MSSISNYGSSIGGLQSRGNLVESASLSEKRTSFQASESRSLELSLTTNEGDTVTISAGSFMDFASLSYDSSGRISSGSQSASATVSSREMTLASGSQFTFSVKGSLSEQEMDDIEEIVKTLDEVINTMATGDMDDAMSKALEMQQGYESVESFEADLSYSSAYRFEQEIAKQAYYSDSEELSDSSEEQSDSEVIESGLSNQTLPDLTTDSSSSLLDMMLKAMEELQEQSLAVSKKAAEPIDQLLTHHMDLINNMGEEDETKESLLNELANAREGMAEAFRKMMPEQQSFHQMASSFFNNE